MKRLASHVVAFACALVAAAVARDVRADAPATSKTGAVQAFTSLPAGHVAPLPDGTTAPRHLAPGERVPGFVPVGMPADQARQMKRYREDTDVTYVFSSEARAKVFASHGGGQDDVAVCMVDGGDAKSLRASGGSGNDDDGDAAPRDWPATAQGMLAFQFELHPGAQAEARALRLKRLVRTTGESDVHIVHAERFAAGSDGHASLEITNAWVDVRTRGVRLLDRSTLPLARTFVGPNGLEVYAARDADAVQVVIRSPSHPSDDAALAEQLRERLRGLNVSLPENNAGSSDCGHFRFVLRPAAGEGQMATLQSVAFLPPLDGDVPAPPEGTTNETRASLVLQSMRQRPFQLSVSATASSADSSPLVSIALGWIGRERTGG